MRVRADIIGDIRTLLDKELRAGERAVLTAVGSAGTSLKDAWRGEIGSAGLGLRLGRTVRSQLYPKGRPSLNVAALVWSKAPEIVGAHASGALIRARGQVMLAIPTPAAGRGRGGARMTPSEWERRSGLRLVMIYRPGKTSLLIAEGRINKGGRAVASRSKTGRGLTSVPIFILVPQVKLRKRLDLESAASRIASGLPASIVRHWRD